MLLEEKHKGFFPSRELFMITNDTLGLLNCRRTEDETRKLSQFGSDSASL